MRPGEDRLCPCTPCTFPPRPLSLQLTGMRFSRIGLGPESDFTYGRQTGLHSSISDAMHISCFLQMTSMLPSRLHSMWHYALPHAHSPCEAVEPSSLSGLPRGRINSMMLRWPLRGLVNKAASQSAMASKRGRQASSTWIISSVSASV